MKKDYFVLALRNIQNRKLRSFLTIIGIVISIATIFVLISLSLGLQGAVEEQFRILGADKLFIQPSSGFLGPPGTSGVVLTERDIGAVKKVRGVKDYTYYVAGNAKVEFSNQIIFKNVWGMPAEHITVFTEVNSYKIQEGNFLEDGDENEIVLGWLHGQGKVFKDEVLVGNKLDINGKNFKVKGIMQRIGNPDDDSAIFMDIETFRELFEIPERIDFIVVQVEEGEDLNEVSERIEKELRKSRGLTEKTQDFEITKPEELLESFGNVLNIITAFLAGIAAISLLVGGIGIANTMYTSVLERTKEIGIMKAVGARNKDILNIFLIESGLLGLVGGVVGVAFGIAISKTIEYVAITQLNTTLLQVATPFYLIFGCLTFGFLIGVVSGTLPAMQASRTNVVDALRHE